MTGLTGLNCRDLYIEQRSQRQINRRKKLIYFIENTPKDCTTEVFQQTMEKINRKLDKIAVENNIFLKDLRIVQQIDDAETARFYRRLDDNDRLLSLIFIVSTIVVAVLAVIALTLAVCIL